MTDTGSSLRRSDLVPVEPADGVSLSPGAEHCVNTGPGETRALRVRSGQRRLVAEWA